jgi:hypothetical protein
MEWGFIVAHSTFLLAYWAIFKCEAYNRRLPWRRSHSSTSHPRSPARDGRDAQFCYPPAGPPDLAEGREVVPRFAVSIFGLPSGNSIGPITPIGPLITPHEPTHPVHWRGSGDQVYNGGETLALNQPLLSWDVCDTAGGPTRRSRAGGGAGPGVVLYIERCASLYPYIE